MVEDANFLAATFPYASVPTKASKGKGKAGKKLVKPGVVRTRYVEAAVLLQKASTAAIFTVAIGRQNHWQNHQLCRRDVATVF